MAARVVESPRFLDELRRLARKYPHVGEDVHDALTDPAARIDAIPGYHRKLWKMRVRSRDQQRGKSGGFRVIFYFDAGKNPDEKHLLTIYPKAERADLMVDQLLQIYNRFMASIKVRDP